MSTHPAAAGRPRRSSWAGCWTSTSTSTCPPTPRRRSARRWPRTPTSRRRSTPPWPPTWPRPTRRRRPSAAAELDDHPGPGRRRERRDQPDVGHRAGRGRRRARRDRTPAPAAPGGGARDPARRPRASRRRRPPTTTRRRRPSRRTAPARSPSSGRCCASAAGSWTISNTAQAGARCTDCRATAIAFQVVIVEGQPTQVAPVNKAVAVNDQCTRCVVYAGARQLVRVVDKPVRFTAKGALTLARRAPRPARARAPGPDRRPARRGARGAGGARARRA